MSNPPLVSPLMLPAETYTDIDHAHQALLALQYPTSGCNIHKIVVKSYIYFRCDGDSSVGRSEHNHARVTTYHPRTGSALWRVLLRDPTNHRTSRAPSLASEYATETGGSAERDEYRGNNDSNGSTPTVQSPSAECRRRHTSSSADDLEDNPNERRAPPSPALPGDMNLEDDRDEKPKVDDDEVYQVKSDDDSTPDSLSTFLASLSSTFRLSKFVNIFRAPEIGVETTEQLIEVCEWDMDGLMYVAGEKLGFGPANAFRQGMKKVLEEKKQLESER